jgi:hypothetical protein
MRTATRNPVAISNGAELRSAREQIYAEFQAHQGVDKLSKQLSNMSGCSTHELVVTMPIA